MIAFIPPNPGGSPVRWGLASPIYRGRDRQRLLFHSVMAEPELGPAPPDSQAKVWERDPWTSPCLALLFHFGQVLCRLWAHFLTSTMRSPGCQFSHSWTNNPLTSPRLNPLPLYLSPLFNCLNIIMYLKAG